MGIVSDSLEKIKKKNIIKLNEQQIKDALKVVIDPDLNKDIVSLGFVTSVEIVEGVVNLVINLTTPACPAKESLKAQAKDAVLQLPGVKQVNIEMTASARTKATTTINQLTAQSLGQVENIIAVASGKGGVGKSTTTLNLAYALAAQGAKVGVMDADIYGPSQGLLTKAQTPTTNADNLIVPSIVNGVKILTLANFAHGHKAAVLRGPMAANIIRQFLSQVQWGELHYLLIDYPPGTGDIQLTISQTAPISGAIIVTTPQEMALIDVRKSIEMFELMKVPVIGIIENMSYFVCDNCDKKHFIFGQGGGQRLARELGLPLLGEVAMDRELMEACEKGLALTTQNSKNPSCESFLKISQKAASELSIIKNLESKALKQIHIKWEN